MDCRNDEDKAISATMDQSFISKNSAFGFGSKCFKGTLKYIATKIDRTLRVKRRQDILATNTLVRTTRLKWQLMVCNTYAASLKSSSTFLRLSQDK